MSEFTEIRTKSPKKKQKEIELKIGYSDSTIKSYRDQVNVPCPFNRKIAKWKKMSCQESSMTLRNAKAGNWETQNKIFSLKELTDKTCNEN